MTNSNDPKKRCKVNKIKEMIAKKEHNISYAPLSCSQATALEESDRIVAKQQTISESPVLPIDDGTKACSFLSLAIIELLEMIRHKLVNDHAMTRENIFIPEFPKSINRLRNVNEMHAVNEAYGILNSLNLLKRSYQFIDKASKIIQFFHTSFSSNQKKCWKK